MKKLALALGSISIAVLAIAIAYTILTPKTFTPAKLPATQKALGRTVTLKSVKRISRDVVQVVLETENRQGVTYVNNIPEVTISGRLPEGYCDPLLDGVDRSIPVAGGFELSTLTTRFVVPVSAHFINLTREFKIDRPSKRVTVSFRDIPITNLPVTRSFNGTAVTLKSILVNQPVDRTKWEIYHTHKDVILAGGPSFILQVSMKTRQDFIHTFGGQNLRDDSGNEYAIAYLYDAIGSAAEPHEPGIDATPLLDERIVHYFDRDTARRMWERRCEIEHRTQAKVLARTTVTAEYLYAFPAINPPPKKISFETSGHYAADNNDRARVVFRNVPIQ